MQRPMFASGCKEKKWEISSYWRFWDWWFFWRWPDCERIEEKAAAAAIAAAVTRGAARKSKHGKEESLL